MKNYFFFFFVLCVLDLSAQPNLEFGFGFNREITFLDGGVDAVVLEDSTFFLNDESVTSPFQGGRADPRANLFVKWIFLERERFSFSTSLFYQTKWSTLLSMRLSDDPQRPNPGGVRPVWVSKHAFFTPLQVRWTPFTGKPSRRVKPLIESIRLGAGIGPTFLFGDEYRSRRIDHYDLGLLNDRKDPFYYEAYYQFQENSHKSITLDYNISFSFRIWEKIGVQFTNNGSFGRITKPFKVFGKTYNVPIIRRGLALFLTYSLR